MNLHEALRIITDTFTMYIARHRKTNKYNMLNDGAEKNEAGEAEKCCLEYEEDTRQF